MRSNLLYLYIMNTLIVDDNAIARDTLAELSKRVKDIVITGQCADAVEAYALIKENAVDLVLLDIEMPGLSGLDLTRSLGDKRPVIIFTTSKRDYAVEAFELNVADYLVKPITPARFLQAIDRAREIISSREEEVSFADDEFIFIRDSNIIKRLHLDDILYAEAMGDYVKLHTKQRFLAIHTTLRAVEDRLPPHRFLRVHRSYIVAIDKIDTIRDGVLIVQDKPVPVADAYRSGLNRRMNVL